MNQQNKKDELSDVVLSLSPLGHTWVFDLDGTIVKHNGYKLDGEDTLLEGAAVFFASLPKEDFVLFLTSREQKYADMTESFLKAHGIRYDAIVFGAPYGERILINDCKPSGLETAFAVNTNRDQFKRIILSIDEKK